LSLLSGAEFPLGSHDRDIRRKHWYEPNGSQTDAEGDDIKGISFGIYVQQTYSTSEASGCLAEVRAKLDPFVLLGGVTPHRR
jgi:hypothetical protein